MRATSVAAHLSTLAVVASCGCLAASENCGVGSLFDLCEAAGRGLTTEQRQRIAEAYPAAECSLLDIVRAAESAGVTLLGVRAALDELAQSSGPKIMHLTDPAHFVVMCRVSPWRVQLLDGGRVVVRAREEIERRYTGHALIMEQGGEGAGPRLQLDDFHYSFGIAGVGEVVEHAFKLTNAGDGELSVRVRAAGCVPVVASSVGKELLAPGEGTDVTLRLKIAASGNLMESVTLLTNDLSQPVAYLTLEGRIPHDLAATPDRLYVFAQAGETPSHIVTVSGPPDMDITEAACDEGLFRVGLIGPELGEEDKKTWTVELTLQPPPFVGRMQDKLAIHTTHPRRRLITIPISVEIRGDLDAEPRMVFFGFAKPNSQLRQDMVIRSRSSRPFQVKAATCDDPRVAVGAPRQLEGGSWQVPVSVSSRDEGVVDATVVVTTNVPAEERLEVPVYAHVLRRE